MSETGTEQKRETEVVVGTIKGIVIKGGDKWTVTVEPDGSQYTKNLWTKSSTLVEEAQQLIGDRQAFQCGVSNYTDSKTGEPRHSLWINGMTSAEAGAQSTGRSSQTGNGKAQQDVDWDAKERRDYRSRAWAQTLATFQHTVKTDEDPILVFERLRPFQQKVYADVTGDFGELPAEAPGLSPADDGIPF